MDMRMGMVALAVMLAACGDADGTAAVNKQAKAEAVRRLDVAGVAPGMSDTQVRAALTRGGWKVETLPGPNWAAVVAEERGRQRAASTSTPARDGVEAIRAGKGEESLVITMRPVPTGTVVKHVAYEAPMAGRTSRQLEAQMIGRYGSPDVSGPTQAPVDMTWCSGGERCRMAPGAAEPALSVREDVYHKIVIHLYDGVAADRAWRDNVARAAGVGTGARSSF